MVAPLKVVDVPLIVIGEANPMVVDFSHLTTLPTLPLKLRSAGEVPVQMVWSEETAPPTDVASTVMDVELLLVQLKPFCAVTIYCVLTVGATAVGF